MGRFLGRLVLFLLFMALAVAAYFRVTYGDGKPYAFTPPPALLPITALQSVVTYDEPIGNVAVAADGRIFFTVHPEAGPRGNKLLVANGTDIKPFPSADQQSLFDTVLGVRIDDQDRLWTIDSGYHGLRSARLLAFDIASGKVVHDHVFGHDIAPLGSYLQDMAVAPDGKTIYIADVSFLRRNPAIIVYDVASQSARRVLEGHSSVFPQNWVINNQVRIMRFFGGLLELKAGVDGITLDPAGEWLVYGAMNHDTLFRIRTSDLLNPKLDNADLAARLQSMGPKPLSDGLSHDMQGNIYITDVEHSAVMRKTMDGRLETVVRDSRIRWADSLSYGPAGYLYVADSAIPDVLLQSQAHIDAARPYHIFRFRPGVDGDPGQ
jgi:sugar lactone lactonase YvrE